MQPFVGFAPDLDATTPGIITACENLIPTTKGYKNLPKLESTGTNSLSPVLAFNSMAMVKKLDGTRRLFCGTNSTGGKLYELPPSTASWNDASRTTGGAYTNSGPWTFEQFGDYTLAAADGQVLQAIGPSGTDFADVSGGPEATYIAVSGGFVMAANIDGETDRWKCCAFQDHTDWTLDVATECVTGRLIESPGPITGIKRFGGGFVIFKENAMWAGQYVGAPEVWRWTLISESIGTTNNGSIVSVGNSLLFIGEDDFYSFDGTRPVSLNTPLREWFFDNSNWDVRVFSVFDERAGNVYWFYGSGGSYVSRSVIYNIRTNKWGYANTRYHAAAYIDEFDTVTPIAHCLLVIDETVATKSLTGAMPSTSCTLTTWNIGDETEYTYISRLVPRFVTAPTASTLIHYADAGSDNVNMVNGRYDLSRSARWHKFVISFVGEVEIVGIRLDAVKDGSE